MRLNNRTAIVTGGASGIGKAIAQRFAEEGAHVIVADVIATPLEGGAETVAAIQDAGGTAEFMACDVTKSVDLEAAVARAVTHGGRLDIMVNNAATRCSKPMHETTEDDWDRVMGVNAKGVFLGCRAAVRQMLNQEARDEVRGRIVNISSQHGMVRGPHAFAYGVGKSTVVYMTRQIAGDYAEHGIVCNAVAPGKILTGKTGTPVAPEALKYSHSRTPWPRLGRPSDVANAALFLASDEATFITGENLMVDGGWMAS
ncbi:MAG: SDR family NAD(P)-dependent oxidoreductase [Alphaproteobacteria bacterium]